MADDELADLLRRASVSGIDPNLEEELSRELMRARTSTPTQIRDLVRGLPAEVQSGLGVIVLETFEDERSEFGDLLLVQIWAAGLERLEAAHPRLPPWRLDSWKWDNPEELFFEGLYDRVTVWNSARFDGFVQVGAHDEAPNARWAICDAGTVWCGSNRLPFTESTEIALAGWVDDRDERLRESALWALSMLPRPRLSAALPGLCKDPSGRVRAAAISVLGKLERADPNPEVLAAGSDAHPWVRVSALQVLEVTHPDAALAMAASLKDDPDEWVKAKALAAEKRLVNRTNRS